MSALREFKPNSKPSASEASEKYIFTNNDLWKLLIFTLGDKQLGLYLNLDILWGRGQRLFWPAYKIIGGGGGVSHSGPL